VIERYDTTLFGAHMVQHLLLLFPIPILLLRAAPVTLLLRLASPRWRARLLALLQSRAVGVISHPLVAWILLAFVMWATHLSPLFDAALESPLIHDLEHLLYLTTALLFWAPVFSLDPIRHRLSRPAALAYLFTQMPQNSFLGVAIMWSPRVLYPALREPEPELGPFAARRPAARWRADVAGGGRPLPPGDLRRAGNLDARGGAARVALRYG